MTDPALSKAGLGLAERLARWLFRQPVVRVRAEVRRAEAEGEPFLYVEVANLGPASVYLNALMIPFKGRWVCPVLQQGPGWGPERDEVRPGMSGVWFAGLGSCSLEFRDLGATDRLRVPVVVQDKVDRWWFSPRLDIPCNHDGQQYPGPISRDASGRMSLGRSTVKVVPISPEDRRRLRLHAPW